MRISIDQCPKLIEKGFEILRANYDSLTIQELDKATLIWKDLVIDFSTKEAVDQMISQLEIEKNIIIVKSHKYNGN